jgi:hypothetical protein
MAAMGAAAATTRKTMREVLKERLELSVSGKDSAVMSILSIHTGPAS